MKNLLYSMLIVLSVAALLGNLSKADIPCSTVKSKAAACVAYATGNAATPSATCCSNLRQLAQSVKTVKDKRDICNCIKAAGQSLGVQDRYLSQIPSYCKVNVGFTISTSTNCAKIQ